MHFEAWKGNNDSILSKKFHLKLITELWQNYYCLNLGHFWEDETNIELILFDLHNYFTD
jgi:hypothetical protein